MFIMCLESSIHTHAEDGGLEGCTICIRVVQTDDRYFFPSISDDMADLMIVYSVPT